MTEQRYDRYAVHDGNPRRRRNGLHHRQDSDPDHDHEYDEDDNGGGDGADEMDVNNDQDIVNEAGPIVQQNGYGNPNNGNGYYIGNGNGNYIGIDFNQDGVESRFIPMPLVGSRINDVDVSPEIIQQHQSFILSLQRLMTDHDDNGDDVVATNRGASLASSLAYPEDLIIRLAQDLQWSIDEVELYAYHYLHYLLEMESEPQILGLSRRPENLQEHVRDPASSASAVDQDRIQQESFSTTPIASGDALRTGSRLSNTSNNGVIVDPATNRSDHEIVESLPISATNVLTDGTGAVSLRTTTLVAAASITASGVASPLARSTPATLGIPWNDDEALLFDLLVTRYRTSQTTSSSSSSLPGNNSGAFGGSVLGNNHPLGDLEWAEHVAQHFPGRSAADVLLRYYQVARPSSSLSSSIPRHG